MGLTFLNSIVFWKVQLSGLLGMLRYVKQSPALNLAAFCLDMWYGAQNLMSKC